MEFKEVVGTRRSIQFFKPWKPVERDKIQVIFEGTSEIRRHIFGRALTGLELR